MTAEVALLNRLGVALAADSAVTIPTSRSTKIYQSANKLFPLSDSLPIGIMISGNANLMNIPWETIIKIYRSRSVGREFKTVKEQADNFIAFLDNNSWFFPADVQKQKIQEILTWLFIGLRKQLDNRLEIKQKEESVPLTPALSESTLIEIGKDFLKHLRNRKHLTSLPQDHANVIARKYQREIAEIREEVFAEIVSKVSTKRLLTQISSELFAREYFGPTYSGVVVAGFGTKEIYPNLVEIAVQCVAANRLKYVKRRSISIDSEYRAAIVPFAQSEMVHVFMEGIDENLLKDMKDISGDFLTGFVRSICDAVASKEDKSEHLQQKLGSILEEKLPVLYKKWDNERKLRFVEPITNVVASLPKDELAAMAESLIHLTSLKRRVSTDEETVGGPIDVAMITKGDGLIWIRRKHYFNPDLNPRYMSRISGRR